MRIRYWSSDVCSSDLAGPATIESYTVFYGRDATPKAGVVVARTPEGKRTLAHVDVGDPTMLAFLTDGKVEPVGTPGKVVALAEGFGWRTARSCSSLRAERSNPEQFTPDRQRVV